MALHLLELGVQQADFLDVVIVAGAKRSCVAVNSDTVAYIERVFDKDEDD